MTRARIKVLILICGFLFFRCSQEKNKLKIIFTGDLMMDRGVRQQIESRNVDYLFDDVKGLFKNCDFTIANFEGVSCDTSLKPIDKKFTFRFNPEWLPALSGNGITHVNLANNHSFDFGKEGISQTISNLKSADVYPFGVMENTDSVCTPLLLEKNNTKIAVFSSCFLKQTNDVVCNENAVTLSEKIKAFKENNPACIVFVCLHWGIELDTLPAKEQVEQAHLLIDSGADAIIGHHPHVVQTIEFYQGKYIFYSVGNFIFDNDKVPLNQGILPEFSFNKENIESVKVFPFHIMKSKPTLMDKSDSEKFMKKIYSISQTVNINQKNDHWEIL